MTNFHLQDEDFKKSLGLLFSVFRSQRQQICIYICLQKTKQTENGNFRCLLQMETENGSVFSLVRKR
jgi:hypothetical protein